LLAVLVEFTANANLIQSLAFVIQDTVELIAALVLLDIILQEATVPLMLFA